MNIAMVFRVGIGGVNVSCTPGNKPLVGVGSGMLIMTAGLQILLDCVSALCRYLCILGQSQTLGDRHEQLIFTYQESLNHYSL